MKSFFINPKLKEEIYSLDKVTTSKLTMLINLLENHDKNLSMPYSKKISQNLYELRVNSQQQLRVFYCFYKDKIIFIHYIIKKCQKTPHQDIQTALKRIKLLTNT